MNVLRDGTSLWCPAQGLGISCGIKNTAGSPDCRRCQRSTLPCGPVFTTNIGSSRAGEYDRTDAQRA